MRPNMDGNLPPRRVWFRYASFARYSTSGMSSAQPPRRGGDESACTALRDAAPEAHPTACAACALRDHELPRFALRSRTFPYVSTQSLTVPERRSDNAKHRPPRVIPRRGGDEPACKPGPVVGDHLSEAARCRVAHATYPGTSREQRSGGVRSRWNRPSWSCSRWGLPSRPSHLGRWGSLTPPFHPYPLPGGLFSVALSRGSPRVGVTHHLALRSPDFPQPCIRAAITRPTRPTDHSIDAA